MSCNQKWYYHMKQSFCVWSGNKHGLCIMKSYYTNPVINNCDYNAGFNGRDVSIKALSVRHEKAMDDLEMAIEAKKDLEQKICKVL